MLLSNLVVLRYAISKKTISAKMTPTLKDKAARNPLMAAVSSNTKKTGPNKKERKKPSGIAVKRS